MKMSIHKVYLDGNNKDYYKIYNITNNINLSTEGYTNIILTRDNICITYIGYFKGDISDLNVTEEEDKNLYKIMKIFILHYYNRLSFRNICSLLFTCKNFYIIIYYYIVAKINIK